jgi:hypothetical protein
MARRLSSFTGTELGWIISDKISLAAPEYSPRQSYLICMNSLDQQLQRFWENEDTNNSMKFCEKNTSRSIPHKIPYILESNPHPFYSFRGLKFQMRIIIVCGLHSRSRAGF